MRSVPPLRLARFDYRQTRRHGHRRLLSSCPSRSRGRESPDVASEIVFAFALVIGALMVKPMVENSASGILLVARPMFSVGDQIETTVFRATVDEIGSRAIKLRTDDGVIVYVSDNQVLGNPIQVYSSSDSRKASFEIGIPADTDLDHATSAIVSATSALSSAGIHLTVRSVTVTQASPEHPPSMASAADDEGSDGDEDSSSTS